MRIPFAAFISLVLVGVVRGTVWLMSGVSQALIEFYQAAPSVCWAICMAPALLGAAALWRVFRLMEHPATMLTLVQSANVLQHHRKELRVALVAVAMLALSAGLLSAAGRASMEFDAPMLGTTFFVSVSLLFSLALVVLAALRLRKVTRFVQHNPLFG